jgi:hypothetical protein
LGAVGCSAACEKNGGFGMKVFQYQAAGRSVGLKSTVEYTVGIGGKANGKGWWLDERKSRCDE